MKRKTLIVGAIEANCTILWEDPSAAWIIDPGADAEQITGYLKEAGLKPGLVAFTHGHFDHIGAVNDILAAYPGVPVHIHPLDVQIAFHPANCWMPVYPATKRPATLVEDLCEGAVLECGGISARILHTPGHTPGSVCFYFEQEKMLASGDTLFFGSFGRTDFPGGSMEQMKLSLKRLGTLPPETVVVCGHGIDTDIRTEKGRNGYMS